VAGAMAIGVALNRRIRGIRFYRLAVFIPVVTSTVATGIVFLWLLDPTFGLVNWILSQLGLPQQKFLQDPNQALYCIVAMTVWSWLGFDVIIYLAALQGIPRDLMEAAEIDGASKWSSFRSIVVPLLGPATLFLTVWSTINALQLFDEIYVTTRGGPLSSTTVIVYYLYQQAFQFFNGGYGAAIAYVLFIAILIVTVIQLWIGNRRVYYSS
jgi:multiple sugar transport system permease protein